MLLLNLRPAFCKSATERISIHLMLLLNPKYKKPYLDGFNFNTSYVVIKLDINFTYNDCFPFQYILCCY